MDKTEANADTDKPIVCFPPDTTLYVFGEYTIEVDQGGIDAFTDPTFPFDRVKGDN